MPSNLLILCHPFLLLPSFFPSIRVFSNESALHIRWPKYWSFSFSISPSNEHSGLISCRMDWLDLLAVQGTLKSLLQHHSSKASILWRSTYFTVQLSHPYMTIVKIIALTRWTFVGKVMSLLFIFSSVQFSSVSQSCPTLCCPMNCSTPGLPVHHKLLELLKLMPIESLMPSSHLIFCRPLLLLPFYIRDLQIKTTVRYLTPSQCPSSESLQTENAGEGVEQRECSCTVGGNVN